MEFAPVYQWTVTYGSSFPGISCDRTVIPLTYMSFSSSTSLLHHVVPLASGSWVGSQVLFPTLSPKPRAAMLTCRSTAALAVGPLAQQLGCRIPHRQPCPAHRRDFKSVVVRWIRHPIELHQVADNYPVHPEISAGARDRLGSAIHRERQPAQRGFGKLIPERLKLGRHHGVIAVCGNLC